MVIMVDIISYSTGGLYAVVVVLFSLPANKSQRGRAAAITMMSKSNSANDSNIPPEMMFCVWHVFQVGRWYWLDPFLGLPCPKSCSLLCTVYYESSYYLHGGGGVIFSHEIWYLEAKHQHQHRHCGGFMKSRGIIRLKSAGSLEPIPMATQRQTVPLDTSQMRTIISWNRLPITQYIELCRLVVNSLPQEFESSRVLLALNLGRDS